jgi:hypothetical protein
MTQENNQTEEKEVNHTVENLESVGQMILGEIESIGGILTGDPITRAEGDFNVESGLLHQEANRALDAADGPEDETEEEE